MLDFFPVNTFCQKDVVGITRHVLTTISAFSFTMLLLDRILTHIVNHISNTSYHLQYLYCQGGYVFGAKPNLITCVGYFFLVQLPECRNKHFEGGFSRGSDKISKYFHRSKKKLEFAFSPLKATKKI
jgi:hypothetical protein